MRRSPLRRRSKNPKAVTRLSLGNLLSDWVRAEGVCVYCGRKRPPEALHGHHLITRGSDRSLLLCWRNIVPVCGDSSFGQESCHGIAESAPLVFKRRIEELKPGIFAHLRLLSRTVWFKKPLDEAEAEIRQAMKRPWSERWEELEVAA